MPNVSFSIIFASSTAMPSAICHPHVFFIQCLIKYTNNVIDKTEKLSNSQIKKIIKESIKATAEFIQHTPTICKSSYIYNLIIDFYISDYTYFIKNKDVEPIKILIDIVKKSKVK